MNHVTRSSKLFALACIAVTGLLFSVSSSELAVTAQNKSQQTASEKPVAIFEDQDTMLRPEGYREWVFVGSSTGLNYSPNPAPSSSTSGTDFKNVYINPSSYREFVKTGTFPEGTVMVLEIAQAANKNEPGLQGSFASKYVALEASVKDSKRFPGGWAYFGFTERDGTLKAKTKPFPDSACLACHQQKAATDRVFTQFYPVLNAARAK